MILTIITGVALVLLFALITVAAYAKQQHDLNVSLRGRLDAFRADHVKELLAISAAHADEVASLLTDLDTLRMTTDGLLVSLELALAAARTEVTVAVAAKSELDGSISKIMRKRDSSGRFMRSV